MFLMKKQQRRKQTKMEQIIIKEGFTRIYNNHKMMSFYIDRISYHNVARW